MAAALTKAGTDPRWRFPSHRAVWAEFCIEYLLHGIPDDQGVRLNTPAALPIEPRLKKALEVFPWTYRQDELQERMQSEDIDEALDIWTDRWEAATIACAKKLGIPVTEWMSGQSGRANGEIEPPEERGSNPIPARSTHLPLSIRQLRRTWSMMREWMVESEKATTFMARHQLARRQKSILDRADRLHSLRYDFISSISEAATREQLKKATEKLDAERLETWKKQMNLMGPACRFVK
eukprot:2684577-Amphidinium_carterae.2